MHRRLGSLVLTLAAVSAAAEPAQPAQDRDFADMTARARAAAAAALPAAPLGAPPATVRVWRRRVDHSTASCSGRVDVIPFEDYVKGVVPNEWISSWDDKALEMGAVCARTFAWWWVLAGGKYDCADVDDTTASQVYGETRIAKVSAAVDRTAGVAAVKDGALVFAEYSAENGDPTADGVDEPYCAGQTVNGHGHGACQWGTQRWATKEGRDYHWMVAHYYPGAVALAPGVPLPDAPVPAASDAPPAPPDAASDTKLTGDATGGCAVGGSRPPSAFWLLALLAIRRRGRAGAR